MYKCLHFLWNFLSAGPESGIGNKWRKCSTHRDNGQRTCLEFLSFGRGKWVLGVGSGEWVVWTWVQSQQQPLAVIDVELGQLIRRTSWKMCPCRNIETGTSQPTRSDPLPLWIAYRCPGLLAQNWLTGDLDPGAGPANWREILAHKSIGQWICIGQPQSPCS